MLDRLNDIECLFEKSDISDVNIVGVVTKNKIEFISGANGKSYIFHRLEDAGLQSSYEQFVVSAVNSEDPAVPKAFIICDRELMLSDSYFYDGSLFIDESSGAVYLVAGIAAYYSIQTCEEGYAIDLIYKRHSADIWSDLKYVWLKSVYLDKNFQELPHRPTDVDCIDGSFIDNLENEFSGRFSDFDLAQVAPPAGYSVISPDFYYKDDVLIATDKSSYFVKASEKWHPLDIATLRALLSADLLSGASASKLRYLLSS